MIKYTTKKGYFKITHILFSDNVYVRDFYKLVNYSYTRKNLSRPLFVKVRRQTRIIDLTQDIEDIFKDFGYYNRRKIRKALKLNLSYSTGNDVDKFIDNYNEFARKKNLKQLSNDNLKGIRNFVITKVTLNSRTVATRYYIIDTEHSVARAVYGATSRLEASSDAKVIGWANRYLHFEDMKYFKSKQIKTYDMGGTAEHTKKKAAHHIDEFKKEFGGRVVDEYVYESFPLFLALKLKELFFHHYPY